MGKDTGEADPGALVMVEELGAREDGSAREKQARSLLQQA
jgi:hypothetical protein